MNGLKALNGKNRHTALFLFFIFAVLTSGFLSAQQSKSPTAAERGKAAEEFRRGIQAWHRGAFNDSLVQFEKALSYLPSENLILDWLGKAYYRSGIEGAALQQWQQAYDNGYGGLLLQNRIETVQSRRIGFAKERALVNENSENTTASAALRFTEAGSFTGKKSDELRFSRPVSLLPLDDGSLWVIAYGTNELLHFDVNGLIINRTRGSLTGFDRPMDILRQNSGNLLVSEYAGDRISQLDSSGRFIKYIGSKGRGTGQFVGPQFLAQDSSGNIYVTDYGNGRVSVFNADGEALFAFGKFASPAGIAVADDFVYVADAVEGSVSVYDTSGNFLNMLTERKTLNKPEALRVSQNYLIVADTNKVLAIDRSSGSINELARTGNAPVRLTCADADLNGNIIASDFKNNEIVILSRIADLAGGFFVQVERVRSDDFPRVSLDVRVQSRSGQPIVGLKDVNFLITEEKRPAAEQKLIGESNANTVCDISLIIDRSYDSARQAQSIDTAVREIAAAMNGKGTLRIIGAGQVPLTEYSGSPSAMKKFSSKNLKTPASAVCAVDLAVRLAANDLINAEPKRAIVYVSAGGTKIKAFDKYGLTDLTAYLNNNGINFLTVALERQSLAPELNYLVQQTGGKQYYVFRPEGIAPLVKDVLAFPCALYRFSYISSLPTDFGRAFLPVEVEAYMLNRSGRDESGYFAPLQ